MREVEKLDVWAVMELVGHKKIAGRVSERIIAGQGFVQVNVPETHEHPAYTRFYGTGAIYAITPVTEVVARAAAERLVASPVSVYIPPWQQLSDPEDPDPADLEEGFEECLEED